MTTIKINIIENGKAIKKEVEYFDEFNIFNQSFYITQDTDNYFKYSVTHGNTGFCINDIYDSVEDAKYFGSNYIKLKGIKKLRKAIFEARFKILISLIPFIKIKA